jgi:hypothetical protein
MITRLGLEGHDSELFSFLDPEMVQQLRKHPSASSSLWTFGCLCLEPSDALSSICSWNIYNDLFPVCTGLVFTAEPGLRSTESNRFHSWRNFTTSDPLVCVDALTVVRYIATQGITAQLDGGDWIRQPMDWPCDRLKFIRDEWSKWKHCPDFESESQWQQAWLEIKHDFFRRCMLALDNVPIGLVEEAAA